MPDPPGVLEVTGSLGLGGVPTVVRDCCEALRNHGYGVDVCLVRADRTREQRVHEIAQLGCGIMACRLRMPACGFARAFRQILRAGRYSVVHAHLGFLSGQVLRVAQEETVPVRLAHYHNAASGSPRPWRRAYRARMERRTFASATTIVACSNAALGVALRGSSAHTPRSAVLYNAIRADRFTASADRHAARAALGVLGHEIVVGWTGYMTPGKNLSAFVRTARRLSDHAPSTHFLLVGDGPDRVRIQRLVAHLGLAGRFHLVGATLNVGYWLSAMDVFLFPSPCEGLGISAIEAQFMGIPVVGYAVPGVSEATAHSDLLAPPHDEAELAARLIALATCPSRLRDLGASASAWAERFSFPSFTRNLSRLYSQELTRYT